MNTDSRTFMKKYLLPLALAIGLLASLVSSFSTEGLADPRKTEVEYATLHDLPLAAVQKMFSGTVVIVCPTATAPPNSLDHILSLQRLPMHSAV